MEAKLNKVVPPEFHANAHHWLILHGRYVCIARAPQCPECLIATCASIPTKPRHQTTRGAAVFAPSRDEARRFLVEAWAKRRAGQPLSGLEQKAAALIALHPEYQPILEAPERHLDRDYAPESGAINPFLHLSLHLAVAEQLAIDQPPGIRAEFERIRAARGDEHEALHAVLECLGEVMWQAQRSASPPDPQLYLDCLARAR